MLLAAKNCENLEEKNDPLKWDKDDFKMLKTLLDDLIPLIRFEAIDSKAFNEKIVPFEKLFDEKVYKEILESYRARKGKLLNLQMKYREIAGGKRPK